MTPKSHNRVIPNNFISIILKQEIQQVNGMLASRKKHGFSLLELMVVVSIIAILAAISLPQFHEHTLRAKIEHGRTFVETIANRTKEYYGVHGHFPTLAQLNYPTDSGSDTDSPPPSVIGELAPYVDYISVTRDNLTSCPSANITAIIGQLTSKNISYLANGIGPDGLMIFDYIIDTDGILVEKCWYAISIDSGDSLLSGDYMSQCANIQDNPNITSEISAITNSC